MDYGHWILSEGVQLTTDSFGFIYEITNTVNNTYTDTTITERLISITDGCKRHVAGNKQI
jgi:hypothetical protein